MLHHKKPNSFLDKHRWIHVLYWILLGIYFFADPSLYQSGVQTVLLASLVYFALYGGGYFVTVHLITVRFLLKGKVAVGVLLILLIAALQLFFYTKIGNMILPIPLPFWQWYLYNLPFSIILLLSAAGISIFTDYLYVVRKVQHLELSKSRQELLVLKSQINPHFLFNNLNSLYALACSKSGSTPTAILQLSELMRYLIEIAPRDLVSLSEELSFLKSYMAMEKLRMNDDAKCQLNTAQADYSDYRIPPLILLPFIENAFKHGAELNPGEIDIQIFLSVQRNVLFFEVSNIFTEIKVNDRNGTGLANIRKRLELIYQDKYTLEIKEEHNCFTVKLSLPL